MPAGFSHELDDDERLPPYDPQRRREADQQLRQETVKRVLSTPALAPYMDLLFGPGSDVDLRWLVTADESQIVRECERALRPWPDEER
jgi:hypothetical protein